MEIRTVLTPLDEKKLTDLFLDHPQIRRQRIHFNRFLGNPIWWVAVRLNGKSSPFVHPRSQEIWMDPRLGDFQCKREVLKKIPGRLKFPSAFTVKCRRHGLMTFGVPLIAGTKPLAVLCMSHIRPGALKQAPLELLHSMVQTLFESTVREYELKRLTESIRPRAIALSTVHTVHRIINSTLNLDELTNRLAHLTAQVLRAKSCAIYLSNFAARSRLLIEKAHAGPGASPHTQKRPRTIRPGEGTEGKVFTTAKTLIRRHVLCVPLIDEDVIGVITLTGKKDGRGGFNAFDQEILTTLAEEAVIAIKNAQLFEEQKKVTLGAIQSLAAILGTKFEHVRRLSPRALLKITLAMADKLRLNEEEKQALHYATLLKDASKFGLPDEILKKPTKLTGQEYRMVRQHPIKGAMIIRSFESLKPVAPIILHSHEHFDGSGYPQGIKGSAIPIGARVLGVVNAFDALVAGRPYRARSTVKEAMEELRRHKGSQFDPRVIEAFEEVIAKPSVTRLLPKT